MFSSQLFVLKYIAVIIVFQDHLPDDFRPTATSSPIPFDEETPTSGHSVSTCDETLDYLYSGSTISVDHFKERFNAIGSKHRLSNAVKSDLLELVKDILPVPNKCPSLYKLTEKELPYTKHVVDGGHVYIMSLEKQMTNICKRFPRCHTMQKCQHSNTIYCDIPDGDGFPEIRPNTIYLLMNTDGLSPILSRRIQVWPIIFSVINLPIPERRKAANLILGGTSLFLY